MITNRLFQEKSTVKTVTIYCSYDVPQLISASFFQEFNKDFPNIRINIKEYPDDYALKKIENNEVELAILPGPFNPHKISYTHLCTESFCLVVNKEHPLAKYDSVPFSKTENESLVIKDSSSFTSMYQVYSFLGSKNAPNIILETSDVHLIHQMAEDSRIVGISLMYLARKIRSDKVKVIPFEEDWLSKKLFLIHNKNNILSNEALLFQEALVNYFRLSGG